MAHLLIIDDNKSMGAFLKKKLEWEDHKVLMSGSGLASVTNFSKYGIDLVLINLTNKSNSGWTVFNQIKRVNAEIPAMLYVSDNFNRTSMTWVMKATREALACIKKSEQENITPRPSGGRKSKFMGDVRQYRKEL